MWPKIANPLAHSHKVSYSIDLQSATFDSREQPLTSTDVDILPAMSSKKWQTQVLISVLMMCKLLLGSAYSYKYLSIVSVSLSTRPQRCRRPLYRHELYIKHTKTEFEMSQAAVTDPNSLGEELSRTAGFTRQKQELGETYLVTLESPSDPYSPQNWPFAKK